MKLRPAAAFVLASWYLIGSSPISAAIFKLAVPEEHGLHLYWWPQVKVPDGWVHDEKASRSTGTNMLVPKGESFANAPSVMYGEALYKPRMPETHSLEQLISDDKLDFQDRTLGIVISALPDLKTSDGRSLRCFSFSPPKGSSGSNANWEWTAFGEEGDFYLVFTVSAQSQTALKEALPAFRRLIASYSW